MTKFLLHVSAYRLTLSVGVRSISCIREGMVIKMARELFHPQRMIFVLAPGIFRDQIHHSLKLVHFMMVPRSDFQLRINEYEAK